MGKKSHKTTFPIRTTEIRYIDAAIKAQARAYYKIVYLGKDEQKKVEAMRELHKIKTDNSCLLRDLGFDKYEIQFINSFRFPAIVEVEDVPRFILVEKPKVGKLAPFVKITVPYKVAHKPWGSNIKYIFPRPNEKAETIE